MPLLIPAIVAALMTVMRVLLIAKAGSIVLAVLLFFGFDWAVNKFAIDPALDALSGWMGQVGTGHWGAIAMQWAGVLNIDKAVSVLISAFTTKASINSAKVFLTKAI